MGNPSEGKTFPPDKLCKWCEDILIGEDEKLKGMCTDCIDAGKLNAR